MAGIKQAIATAGVSLLYPPPYSPDLNPIEKLFAKLKALLRKAAKRSVEALRKEIGDLLNTLSSTECANYFTSSGYVCTYIRNALANFLQAQQFKQYERRKFCPVNQVAAPQTPRLDGKAK